MKVPFDDVELTPEEVVQAVLDLASAWHKNERERGEARAQHAGALASLAEVRAQTERLMNHLHMAEQPTWPVEGRLALAVAEVIRRLRVDEQLPSAGRPLARCTSAVPRGR